MAKHLNAKVTKVFIGRHFVQLNITQGVLNKGDKLRFLGSEPTGGSHISVHEAHHIEVEDRPVKHVGAGKKCVIMIDTKEQLPPHGALVFLAS